MPKRADSDYEIEALSKGLAVLEVLIEDGPLRRAKIEQKAKLPRDVVFRTLRTLRLRGYAIDNDREEWSVGPRFIRVAQDATRRV